MAARRFGWLVLCVLACSARAQNIELLDQWYTTDLSFRIISADPATFTRFTSSSETSFTRSAVPLDSTLQSSSPRVFAQAEATTFSASTSTSALWNMANDEVSAFARADAESFLSFRPLRDATTPLQFSVAAGGQFFSDGFFSLYDRTADEFVFAYSWQSHEGRIPKYAPPQGSIPITWQGFYQSSISLDPFLSSSHIYDLVLHAGTDANTDSQHVTLEATGLYPIAAPAPEPSQMSLALAGLIGVLLMSRGRRALSRAQARRHGSERP